METPTLPSRLYIVREDDGQDYFFIAYEDTNDLADAQVVGEYELARVSTIKVTRELI